MDTAQSTDLQIANPYLLIIECASKKKNVVSFKVLIGTFITSLDACLICKILLLVAWRKFSYSKMRLHGVRD